MRERLDIATVAGVALALAGLLGGLLLEGGSIKDVAQITAALIVFGGTAGAVLVTTPMAVVLSALKAFRAVLFEPVVSAASIREDLIVFASKARRNGIVSLELDAEQIEDSFLRKGMRLAVDGADLQEIRRILELEMDIEQRRQASAARVYETAGGYAPTIGIVGAVLGLIQVMKHLEDIKEVGHGIAVAFVATVYGVASANVLFLPAANKLRGRSESLLQLREMMLEGVGAIVEGMNPKLIQIKLEAFLPEERQTRRRAAAEAVAVLEESA